MFSQFKNRDHYPFWFELAPLLLTVALLMVQFFVFKDYTPHVPLVIGICITGMFMALKGRKWAGMEQHMYRVMKVALPTTVIILCVGMMIAASIAAGTVQTVLVYGLSILKPTVFLPARLPRYARVLRPVSRVSRRRSLKTSSRSVAIMSAMPGNAPLNWVLSTNHSL